MASESLIQISALRKQLAEIRTPQDAKRVRDEAGRIRNLCTLLGATLQQANEYAEIHLLAHWKYGELSQAIPEGNQHGVDAMLKVGSPDQRKRARRFQEIARESDIPEYVRAATTEELEIASIAGCLEWLNPGRHGNLKGEYEWYTPQNIIEAAREVLGAIDLDPASCQEANEIVHAREYFNEKDNGLIQRWHGRIFVNPPFAHPTVKYFAEKLLESLELAQVEQAIWLSNACIDVEWWQRLAGKGITCFHRGRIRFYGPVDKGQAPTLGQTIIYLGPQEDKFRKIFSPFGLVLA